VSRGDGATSSQVSVDKEDSRARSLIDVASPHRVNKSRAIPPISETERERHVWLGLPRHSSGNYVAREDVE